jgi:hypothetical protein
MFYLRKNDKKCPIPNKTTTKTEGQNKEEKKKNQNRLQQFNCVWEEITFCECQTVSELRRAKLAEKRTVAVWVH